MEEKLGYVKLHRHTMHWRWYTDPNVFRVFIHLLLNASYKDYEWNNETLLKGQLITTRRRLASELRMDESAVTRALKKLTSTGEIKIKTTNKYSVVTIVKWDFYQNPEDFLNNKRTSTENQANNNRTLYKKEKNVKKYYNNAPAREREHSSIDFSLLDLIINAD